MCRSLGGILWDREYWLDALLEVPFLISCPQMLLPVNSLRPALVPRSALALDLTMELAPVAHHPISSASGLAHDHFMVDHAGTVYRS